MATSLGWLLYRQSFYQLLRRKLVLFCDFFLPLSLGTDVARCVVKERGQIGELGFSVIFLVPALFIVPPVILLVSKKKEKIILDFFLLEQMQLSATK